MDTNQIRELCIYRYNDVFLDCVSIGELENDHLLKELCDKLLLGAFLIFDIDPKSAPGKHWILISRLRDGSLFIFDSFGAAVTDQIFRFENISLEEKSINKLYDPSMRDQLFQWVNYNEKYVDGFTYRSNKGHSFLFSKQSFRSYKQSNNMTVPLFHFLKFSNVLCPRKLEHRAYYFLSQLQPIETIVCGELCILVDEILYRYLKVHLISQATPSLLKKVSYRIHHLFSTANTLKVFVTLVKKYMLTIDNSYKVKKRNVNYFRKLFSTENRNLVV